MTGSRGVQLLHLDKAPFVVTLLLGAFSWIVSHTETRYNNAAILELESYFLSSGLQTRIENISVAKSVDCVDLIFVPQKGESIDNYHITFLTNVLTEHSVRRVGTDVVLQLHSMQPRAAILFSVLGKDLHSTKIFNAHCISDEDGSMRQGALPILKTHSPETFMIKHSLILLWGAWLLCALVLIVSMCSSRRQSDKSNQGK